MHLVTIAHKMQAKITSTILIWRKEWSTLYQFICFCCFILFSLLFIIFFHLSNQGRLSSTWRFKLLAIIKKNGNCNNSCKTAKINLGCQQLFVITVQDVAFSLLINFENNKRKNWPIAKKVLGNTLNLLAKNLPWQNVPFPS